MSRIFVFLALVLASMAANAFDYGRWLCNCGTLDSINASNTAKPPAPVEVIMFIKFNNSAIMASGPIGSSRWVANDRMTVCDGKTCLTVFYQAAGIWIPVPPGTVPDNGKGYQNGTLTISYGAVGGPNSQYGYVFRWIDYTGTQPYQRTGSVTVGPIIPVITPDGGSLGGGNFNSSFDWGAATNSDAAVTGQGGTVICGYAGCRSMSNF